MSLKDTQIQKDTVLETEKTLQNKALKPVFYNRLVRIDERAQRLGSALLVLGEAVKDTAPQVVTAGLFGAADTLVARAQTAGLSGVNRDLEHRLEGLFVALRSGLARLKSAYWAGYITEMNFDLVNASGARLEGELEAILEVLAKRRPGSALRSFSSDMLPLLETEPEPQSDEPLAQASSEISPSIAPKPTPRPVSEELVPSTPQAPSVGSVTAEQRQLKQNRQVRIVGLLSRLGTVSMTDIVDEFPGVSDKTIQRDLKALVKEGKVVKEGERRWSTYRLA